MKIAWQTNVGRTREINEDFAFAQPDIELAILADGMGGHQAGEVASRLAVETLAASVADALLATESGGEIEPVGNILSRSIGAANRAICERAAADPNLKGMGTTIVVALGQGDCVYIAHVGDSRAYLLRDRVLYQMTLDHSLIAEMATAGQISEKEASAHRLRNVLTRTLGNDLEVQADGQMLAWRRDDLLLLCSDGLTTMVEDRKIGKILARYGSNLQAACEVLIREANAEGGKDNITVILACPS